MSDIEKRVIGVDLNNGEINSNYRAALHGKLSRVEVKPDTLRSLANDDSFLPLDPRTTRALHNVHEWMFSQNDDREIILLSSLGVFGLDQYLTQTSPLKIAHVTGRPGDVVADPAVQLSMETFRRRRAGNGGQIRLATFHRCTRLQRYSNKLFKPVFEMFATFDSTLNTQVSNYHVEVISGLVDYYSRMFDHFLPGQARDVVVGNIGIADRLLGKALDDRDESKLEERAGLLSEAMPEELRGNLPVNSIDDNKVLDEFSAEAGITREVASIRRVLESLRRGVVGSNLYYRLDRIQGLGHYRGSVVMMFVNGINLVDGGEVDWVSKLTANNKERSVVSGFGSQLLAGLTIEQEDK